MQISATTLIERVSSNIAETDFDAATILLHIESGKYYNFNETSSDLWKWLQETTTAEKLARMLMEKYDCAYEQALTDVLAFLNEAISQGLVKVA